MIKEIAIHNLFALKLRSRVTSDREALDMAIKALEQTNWYPVSERLPEDCMYCLITVEITPYGCSSNYEVHTAWFDGRNFIGKTDIDHIVAKRGVIAWMPLPQPYNFTES